MRVMTLNAVCCSEGLILMRLLQICIFRIVAVEAERWRRFGEVEPIFKIGIGAGLMGEVTGVAAH